MEISPIPTLSSEINEIREELLEYTKNNITTKHIANEVINISNNFFSSSGQK